MANVYEGGCHCGALSWRYETAHAPTDWTVRACQCSFCRANGVRATSDPGGRVAFSADPVDAVTHYRFGLGITDFLVCARCGVYVGAVIEDAGEYFTTLNLNALKTPVEGLPEPEPMDYGAEDAAGRVARRRARWTPVTQAI